MKFNPIEKTLPFEIEFHVFQSLTTQRNTIDKIIKYLWRTFPSIFFILRERLIKKITCRNENPKIEGISNAGINKNLLNKDFRVYYNKFHEIDEKGSTRHFGYEEQVFLI